MQKWLTLCSPDRCSIAFGSRHPTLGLPQESSQVSVERNLELQSHLYDPCWFQFLAILSPSSHLVTPSSACRTASSHSGPKVDTWLKIADNLTLEYESWEASGMAQLLAFCSLIGFSSSFPKFTFLLKWVKIGSGSLELKSPIWKEVLCSASWLWAWAILPQAEKSYT